MFTPEERTHHIEYNIEYARKIAAYFTRNHGLASIEDDLKSEAVVGLILAVDEYEDDRGMTLASYIHTRVNWRLLRVYNDIIKTIRPPYAKKQRENYKWIKDDVHDMTTITEVIPDVDHLALYLEYEKLKAIFDKLDISERNYNIIYKYLFTNTTYKEVGKPYGLTGERVRQICDQGKVYLKNRYNYELLKQGDKECQ